MISKHGKMSMQNTDKEFDYGKIKKMMKINDDEKGNFNKLRGRDGPKAGMVPLTGQLYEFLMGRSFNIFLDLTKSPHLVRGKAVLS